MSTNDADERLPIKIDSTSNGEFMPLPLPEINRKANALARKTTFEHARRLGQSRRSFLRSAAGAASVLFSFNQVHAAAGRSGGYFELASEATYDDALAVEKLGGNEFVFDVQGHYVVPPNLATKLKPGCRADHEYLSREYMRCIGAEAFIKDIFLDSDTDMMVLSFIPSRREAEPLTIAEAAATREIVERMEGTHRLLIHGRVNPNQDGDLDDMDELAERWGVAAWKCYTQWGPDGVGFHMTDPDTGIPFVEKARRLGIKTICIHKGIPFGRRSYQHSVCTDIGAIAARYPDVNFLIYHAGYVPGQKEGHYRPGRGEGVDELIRSVLDNGLGRGSNVYAELGTTWRMLMRDPQEAAHCVGKLVKHLGEDNVLYGSDCVWYGSPQDQIQAFRSFQITTEFQERFGYPAMTPVLRAKILGLNGARVYDIQVDEILERAGRDTIAASRENYRNDTNPHFRTFGPTTRREFIDLLRLKGGSRA